MGEEYEDVDDLEVREQNADEDKDVTMWSITHDEDDGDDDDDRKYDYFQCYIIITLVIIILLHIMKSYVYNYNTKFLPVHSTNDREPRFMLLQVPLAGRGRPYPRSWPSIAVRCRY